MKKLISAILIITMVFSLAACGANKPETEDPGINDPVDTSAPEVTKEPDLEIGDITDPETDSGVKTLGDPNFQKDLDHQNDDGVSLNSLNAFIRATMPEVFTDLEGENRVYSPLNVYMALAMLAEVTDTETRDQILAVLGEKDVDGLRETIRVLWNVTYSEDDPSDDLPGSTVIPAASMWLRDGDEYKSDVIDALSKYYYASSFSGPMGSPEYTQKLHEWINERTNYLLEEQANNLSLDADTILTLVTTLYFKAGWADHFNKDFTSDDVFHAVHGDETIPFMHATFRCYFYDGESFDALCLSMFGRNSMWILLPTEGKDASELMNDQDAMNFILADDKYELCTYLDVEMSIPKFDVDSDMDLCALLAKLGITDVFNPEVSDFTPLTDEPNLAVSDIEHAARVKIDEEGCEAAAFTAIMIKDAAFMPADKVEFICDRPFAFFITGYADQMLFSGVVNTLSK